jgi:hypothetical protein
MTPADLSHLPMQQMAERPRCLIKLQALSLLQQLRTVAICEIVVNRLSIRIGSGGSQLLNVIRRSAGSPQQSWRTAMQIGPITQKRLKLLRAGFSPVALLGKNPSIMGTGWNQRLGACPSIRKSPSPAE